MRFLRNFVLLWIWGYNATVQNGRVHKSKSRAHIASFVLVNLLVLSNPSGLSAVECVSYSGDGIPTHSTKRIVLYIENDFAAEMRQKTPSSADANLSETQVQSAILQAAEIWNLQTRAVALVYGGTSSYNTFFDFCNQVNVQPGDKAVFVTFHEGTNTGNNLAVVTEGSPSGCPGINHRELVVYGETSGDPYVVRARRI